MPPQDIHVKGEAHIELVKMIVEDAKAAERESHFHELYLELFHHQCLYFSKDNVFISIAPQVEIGNQSFDPGDVGNPERTTRSQTKEDREEFLTLSKARYNVSSESLAHYTDGPSYEVEKSSGEESNGEDGNKKGADATDKNQKPKRKPRRKREPYKIWTPLTTWVRPDFLINARFKTPSGTVNKKVLFILELKMDENALNFERDQSNRDRLTSALPKVVAQVLAQAQYLFAEHRDQDSVHAMIAVGFFFVDFKIIRARLPPLSEGCLYDSKTGQPTMDKKTILQIAGLNGGVKCILTRDGSDLSRFYILAWNKAREPYKELQKH